MIGKRIIKFCKDFHLIENYEKAIADTTQTWHLHHRLETDKGYSKKQLIDLGLYWNRSPEELIFLTPFEHNSLHKKGNKNMLGKPISKESIEKAKQTKLKNGTWPSGENHPCYGTHRSKESIEKAKQTKLKNGTWPSGEKNPMFNYQWSEEQRKHQSEMIKGKYVGEKSPLFGKTCYNNGIKNVFDYTCPEGYVKGMIKKSKH